MNEGIDIKFVRDRYARMTDEELIQVVSQEAAGLTNEARAVVKEEVEKRQLDPNLIAAIKVQNSSMSIPELDKYCELIRTLKCPVCSSSANKLNGTTASEVMSFVIFTNYSKEIKVACPACLDKTNNNALTKTMALGWWGFPWGLIRSIQAIRNNLKHKKTNHLQTPNDFLRALVFSKIGEIELYKNDREKLQQLISKT
jgi:hypothetical protein